MKALKNFDQLEPFASIYLMRQNDTGVIPSRYI